MSEYADKHRNEADLTEVTLARAHTHNGKELTVGDKIKVTPAEKDFLSDRGLIEGSSPKAGFQQDDGSKGPLTGSPQDDAAGSTVSASGGSGMTAGDSARTTSSNPGVRATASGKRS